MISMSYCSCSTKRGLVLSSVEEGRAVNLQQLALPLPSRAQPDLLGLRAK